MPAEYCVSQLLLGHAIPSTVVESIDDRRGPRGIANGRFHHNRGTMIV